MRLWRSRRARIVVAVLLLGGAAFWWMLPRPLFREPLSAVLLARDGALLGARIAADGQWRFPEPEAVPARFARASFGMGSSIGATCTTTSSSRINASKRVSDGTALLSVSN